jgi:hypothetical protein
MSKLILGGFFGIETSPTWFMYLSAKVNENQTSLVQSEIWGGDNRF